MDDEKKPGDSGTNSDSPGPSQFKVDFSGGTPELRDRIVVALKECYDPEIPVDIYELGLIYAIDITDESDAEAIKVALKMTLTSPACPVAGSLPGEVQGRVKGVEGIEDATVDLVWEPPWTPEKMSDVAKLKLDMF